jgi:hypothetical protein
MEFLYPAPLSSLESLCGIRDIPRGQEHFLATQESVRWEITTKDDPQCSVSLSTLSSSPLAWQRLPSRRFILKPVPACKGKGKSHDIREHPRCDRNRRRHDLPRHRLDTPRAFLSKDNP